MEPTSFQTQEDKANHFTSNTVITPGFRTWIKKLLLRHNTLILNVRGVVEIFHISNIAIRMTPTCVHTFTSFFPSEF
jgi:hypothetical protein